MPARIYRVLDTTTGTDYLVRAHTQAQAIRHVVADSAPAACKPEIFEATYEAVESIDDNGWMRIEEDAPIDVPLDTDVHLAWWDEWSESWRQEINHAGSERGGWRHGRATHWRPLPAPPHHQEQGA